MIQAERLEKSYGQQVVLADFDIQLQDGGVTALLGPSGCGKSTLLRILAGADTQYRGSVHSDHRAAMVFQDDRLIPWLTVARNLEFVSGTSETGQAADIERALNLTRLTPYAQRYPDQLSGGQRTRVGIARALASGRRVLLLDEPFGGLDLELKLELIADLGEILTGGDVTAVLVTHDLDEALLMADEILVTAGPPLRVSGRLTPALHRAGRTLFDPRLQEDRKALFDLVTSRD